MKSDIGAAVVGVGFIGVAHVEALRRLGVEVVGVVGSSPERASQKAEAANLPPAFPNLEAASMTPRRRGAPRHPQPPPRRTGPCGPRCQEARRLRKPLALDTAETADLLARAEASGKVHAVCFNIRFLSAVPPGGGAGPHRRDREAAAGPRSCIQDWLLLETDWNWRLESEKAGRLRAVADIGSHWLDLARFVTGQRITEVMADLHTLIPVRRHPRARWRHSPRRLKPTTSSRRDDLRRCRRGLLRFEDGARGPHHFADLGGRKNSLNLEVDGSAAALSWYSEDPDRLWIGHRGRPNEIWQRDPALATDDVARLMRIPAVMSRGTPTPSGRSSPRSTPRWQRGASQITPLPDVCGRPRCGGGDRGGGS